MKQIQPNNLFSKDILDYKVDTRKLGRVNYVNLDNAATTPPFLEVQQTVQDFMISYGSVHRGSGTKSQVSTKNYEDSREVIKKFLGATNDDYVLFSGNTTGAMNMAAYFFSFLEGKVMVSDLEHSSSWLPWIKQEGVKSLGSKQVSIEELAELNEDVQQAGVKQVITYQSNSKGHFDLENIEELLQKNDVKVLVLTASSNLTGYLPPIREIGNLARKYGAYFLVDGCQYIQHHKLNMKEMGIDFLVASGHKIYAPYGEGFLIGSKDVLDAFLPYEIGGGNLPYITRDGTFLRYKNQLAHDPGTPNSLGAVAIATAIQVIQKLGIENIERYERKLADRLFSYLNDNKNIELYLNDPNYSTVFPFNVKGLLSSHVARLLNDDYGIGVRSGSFCVYQVVRKMNKIEDEESIINMVKQGDTNTVPAVVRASIGLGNTEGDIERLITALDEITKDL